jgi:enamine deaminase RidA (YjgF/YER057c/UK114 family)
LTLRANAALDEVAHEHWDERHRQAGGRRHGASDLLVVVLGDAGEHARTAVGVAALPLGAAAEIDALVEIELG